MKLAWNTDPHLNFVKDKVAEALWSEVKSSGADALLLGGDIAEAESFGPWLETIAARLQRPVYFVLGNHDYYHGDLDSVRATARALSRSSPWLHWLPDLGAAPLTPDTSLIGHGGWGDGRLGDFMGSTVMLNDYLLIKDLISPNLPILQSKLGQLGDEAAESVATSLREALDRGPRVVMLTHVPPFHGACWYEGRISDDNWLPHFSCKAVGDVLLSIMEEHPRAYLTVLCGHTHSPGVYQPLPNLLVKTGGAVYREPALQELFRVE